MKFGFYRPDIKKRKELIFLLGVFFQYRSKTMILANINFLARSSEMLHFFEGWHFWDILYIYSEIQKYSI